MARTRMATGGGTSHAPDIFSQHKVQQKYGGSHATKKPQPPANAPGQGHHHGGGYAPGATAGNLVTKGNLNIPSAMYKPSGQKPYVGKTHPYSYVPPVSRISDPAKRTRINLQTVASTGRYGHVAQHGAVAAPATNYSDLHGTPGAPKGAISTGFMRKNQMKPSGGPSIVPFIPVVFPFLIPLWRAGVRLVYGAFRLRSPYDPYATGETIPGQGPGYKGSTWAPSSDYGNPPGGGPELQGGPFQEPPPPIDYFLP